MRPAGLSDLHTPGQHPNEPAVPSSAVYSDPAPSSRRFWLGASKGGECEPMDMNLEPELLLQFTDKADSSVVCVKGQGALKGDPTVFDLQKSEGLSTRGLAYFSPGPQGGDRRSHSYI